MPTEYEKCMAGELYDCHDRSFLARKNRAAGLLEQYNALPYDAPAQRSALLRELFGRTGSHVTVAAGFLCDFGDNIFIGDRVSINYRCTFIDCNRICIGSDVLIAPGVQINTAGHPVELAERLTEGWTPGSGAYRWRTFARPVTIGDGCWIGAGATILGGVTIGRGAVIAAGSVVTCDIPADVLAAGVPCKVIRPINKQQTDNIS